MEVLNKAKGLLICFAPFLCYIIIAHTIGEEHPFSRFTMYSSFVNNSRYYYFADENNQPIPGGAKLHFSIIRLKNGISAQMAKDHVPNRNAANIGYIGNNILKYVINKNTDNPELKKYNQLRIIKCEVLVTNGKVLKTDTVISKCNLNNAY